MTAVAIVTLGCARNEVDSEQLSGLLARSGYRLVDDPGGAEVVVVNTCTFIDPATQESVETVLEACGLKGEGTEAVVVVGCMAERYGQELATALPEADAVVGFDAYPRLATIVGDLIGGRDGPEGAPGGEARGREVGGGPLLPLVPSGGMQPHRAGRSSTRQDELDRIPASGPRFPLRAAPEDRPWAYLKIASGCDRTCTFCAIPSWRGSFRSRPTTEIVEEARWLVSRGVRELVLVSENTTSWGRDLPGGSRSNQPALLRSLGEVEGLERIRLMYLQPAELHTELLRSMVEVDAVVPYFDLSLQHASAGVLRRMARSGSRERFLELVGRIREMEPEAVFRSNFIVGFPGETDDDADELAAFLSEARLDWVGLFAFSPQEGTPAAAFDDAVPAHTVAERLAEVSDVQEAVAEEAARRFVGRRLTLTVEQSGDQGTWGRSYREAPETDGEVRLLPRTGDGPSAADDGHPVVPVGRSLSVDVVATDGVDLLATPAEARDGRVVAAAEHRTGW